MGLEFIRKAAPKYRKGLDRKRIQLGTPDLFMREPEAEPRRFAATIRPGQELITGEKLGVCLDGEQVLALRGLDPVAVFNSPPAELREALAESYGDACGSVEEIHEIASVAEIAVW
jgi:hypothetical protein